jgi:glycosyltransferase involved in cell wall biosynthesis
VHVHGVWRPFCALGVRAALQGGNPVAIAPRGMLDVWSLDQKRLKKRVALELAWQEFFDTCTLIHALNPSEAAAIARLGLRAPVRIVGNGVFPEQFVDPESDTAFRASIPALGVAPYVLFLGRLHHKKGCDHLLEAFGVLCAAGQPGPHLVLAGPDGGVRRSLEQRVVRLGLSGRVHFPGALYGRLKWSALAGASCFCLPSRQEGFSMAVLEALASGVPTVVSHECNFPEVSSAGAGRVVALDAAAIAAALAELLADDAERARIRELARRFVFERYDWSVLATRMVEAYVADLSVDGSDVCRERAAGGLAAVSSRLESRSR